MYLRILFLGICLRESPPVGYKSGRPLKQQLSWEPAVQRGRNEQWLFRLSSQCGHYGREVAPPGGSYLFLSVVTSHSPRGVI